MSLISFSYRNKFLRNEYYYVEYNDFKNVPNGMNSFHCVSSIPNIKKKLIREQYSYILNLKQFKSFEELYLILNKDNRNSFNFCNKLGIEFKIYVVNESNFDIVFEMLSTLKEMYSQKGIKRNFNIGLYKSLAERGNLLITVALYNGLPTVFHTYLINESTAILFHSCSLFRNAGQSKNFIGKINRFLHVKDISYFIDKKYLTYDWGGLFDADGNNSIDQFKKSFPGDVVQYYHIAIPKGFIANLVYFIKKVLGRNS